MYKNYPLFPAHAANFDLFKCIVVDEGYGSETNYQAFVDKFVKIPLISYGMYQKTVS